MIGELLLEAIMKRSEQSEKIEVTCPVCGNKRFITKKAYTKKYGKLTDEIFISIDKSCSQKQKMLTEEHKEKISESLMGYKQSESHIQNKSEYMKAHSEAWQNNIVIKGDSLSHEHKMKISESKKRKRNNE